LQHSGSLAFAQLRQQHDFAIGKLKGVMMGVGPAFVDLPESRHLVPESPSKEHAAFASNLLLEGKLGAGKHANGHARVVN
jgi:hypothetical protein